MSWFRSLTRVERDAILGASAGWALDGFDFVLYSLVIPTLIAAWGMSRAQAGLIATAALLTSSAGGWLAGILADRWGRVKVLQLTVVWFSLCTALSGVCNSFAQLATIRALQGFGFGGEWAVGAVLVAETIGAAHRGKAVGVVQSGYAVGWAAATVAFSLLFSWLPENYAWRVLFFLGLAPALVLVLFLRRRVAEPEVYLAAREAQRRANTHASVFQMFSQSRRRITLLASMLAVGIQGAYYAVVTWLPTFLKSVLNLSVINTTGNLLILIAGSFAGYLIGATSTDRFGRRRTFITFALLSAVTSYLYFRVKLPAVVIMLAGFPLGFMVSGMIGGLGAFLAELFPTSVRGSAIGFTYNFGRVVASAFPPAIGYLSGRYALEAVMMVFAMGSFLCVVVSVALLPETRGRRLDSVEHDA